MTQLNNGQPGTESSAQPVGMDAALRFEGEEPSISQRGAGRREEYPDIQNSPGGKAEGLPARFWLAGWGLVVLVLVATFGLGGSEMAFPTTVSRTEVKTDNGGTLVLEKRCARRSAAPSTTRSTG